MDMNLRSIAVAVVLALGLATFVGSYFAYQSYQQRVDDLEQQLASYKGGGDSRPVVTPEPFVRSSKSRPVRGQQERIDSLRSLLAKKDELLKQQDKLLNEQSEREFALRENLDQALEVLEGTLNKAPESAEAKKAMTDLRQQLEQAKTEDENQSEELANIREELENREEELETFREETETRIAQLEMDHLLFREFTISVLKEIGEPGIDVIAAQLGDETANVRTWAANVLGNIGRPAADALDALEVAAKDNDQDVRAAAIKAIEAIAP